MSKIQEIINKEDRKIFYYDSGPMVRRYARRRASTARRARAAQVTRTTTPTKTPVRVGSRAVHHGITATRAGVLRKKIGHYKGTKNYHSPGRKAARKRHTQRELKRLRLARRYSQLM